MATGVSVTVTVIDFDAVVHSWRAAPVAPSLQA
jgi:Ser/Thr protein kinase RdoA (MazF antagonist)